jgi:hypothetical protein
VGAASAGDEELAGTEATVSGERGEEHDRTAAATATPTTSKAGTFRIGVRDMNDCFQAETRRALGWQSRLPPKRSHNSSAVWSNFSASISVPSL